MLELADKASGGRKLRVNGPGVKPGRKRASRQRRGHRKAIMSDFQQFPVYRATVSDASGARDIITFLSPDEVQQAGGLAPEAVLGMLAPEAEFAPENLQYNPLFVEFLHRVIRETAPGIEELAAGAKAQGAGWILIHDARAFAVDPELAGKDAIGAFPIEDGVIHAGSYSPNPHHRVLTEHGIVTPHPLLQDAVMAALRDLRYDAGDGG
jgi:hypothetical protein